MLVRSRPEKEQERGKKAERVAEKIERGLINSRLAAATIMDLNQEGKVHQLCHISWCNPIEAIQVSLCKFKVNHKTVKEKAQGKQVAMRVGVMAAAVTARRCEGEGGGRGDGL